MLREEPEPAEIIVEYGPVLREAAGLREETLKIAKLDLDVLVSEICRRHPGELSSWLVDGQTQRLSSYILVAVNGRTTRDSNPTLLPGDRVLLTPIIVGG
jgi:molybdopterin converting factor small subunit